MTTAIRSTRPQTEVARAPRAPSLKDRVTSYMMTPESLRPAPLRDTPRNEWPRIDLRRKQYLAPNGERLQRVDVKLQYPDTPVQYALVNARTNEMYFVRGDERGMPMKIEGPVAVPAGLSPSIPRLQAAITRELLSNGGPSTTPRALWPTIEPRRQPTAPDGTPLLEVRINLPHADSQTQYALINPKTREYYFVRAHENAYDVGLVQGPAKLPLN